MALGGCVNIRIGSFGCGYTAASHNDSLCGLLCKFFTCLLSKFARRTRRMIKVKGKLAPGNKARSPFDVAQKSHRGRL